MNIRWPSGVHQQYANLPVNKRLTVTETDQGPVADKGSVQAAWFVRSDLFEEAWHMDPDYDDYQHQSLLPHALSHEGPGMAWGDANGDGENDLFICGGAGQPGRLWLRNADGSFQVSNQPALNADRAAEGQEAVFLDVDADGDMDLFVASGSYEFEAGASQQFNRLYRNDGSGQLSRVAMDDPGEFSGTLCVADFDADGDPDAFVGTRSRQGEFPKAQSSQLLVNDSGQLRDATKQLAPDLMDTGLVTDAVWADVDGDNQLDLVISHEWGTIKVLRNDGGKLAEFDSGPMTDHSVGGTAWQLATSMAMAIRI